MIKRRFYKLDHGDKDASEPDSSSDSEIEAEAESSDESEDEEAIPEVKQDDDADSTSSGYKSEDSSAKDVDVNSSGVLVSEDDAGTINAVPKLKNRELSIKHDSEVSEGKSEVLADENKSLPVDVSSYILQCKSVFKCRICPRIICLTEDTLRDHLQSKRHARSEKLLNEGRLKVILNDYAEIENLGDSEDSEFETRDTEDNAEKNHNGQMQNTKRFKKKKTGNPKTRKMKSTKGSAKKRRKNES